MTFFIEFQRQQRYFFPPFLFRAAHIKAMKDTFLLPICESISMCILPLEREEMNEVWEGKVLSPADKKGVEKEEEKESLDL